MLEAVWDSVQGKVVYVDRAAKVATGGRVQETNASGGTHGTRTIHDSLPRLDPSAPTTRSGDVKPRNRTSYERTLEWRTNNESDIDRRSCVDTGSSRRRSRRTSRSPPQPPRPPVRLSHTLEPIAPDQFHSGVSSSTNGTNKPGMSMVSNLRREIRQRVVDQHTRRNRKELALQRQWFTQQTVYKVYPLQDQAIQHFLQLRLAWGVVEHDTASDDTTSRIPVRHHPCGTALHSTDDASCSSMSLRSMATGSTNSSGSDAPEAKRPLRDRQFSPSQCQSLELFKTMILEQQQRQTFPVDGRDDGACRHDAMWSMEPRLFGVERIGSGKRQYVVAQAGRFFDVYWRLWPSLSSRHVYELIRPHTPCRLYLDLEATVTEHATLVQNTRLQDEFLTELVDELAREWQTWYQTKEQPKTCHEMSHQRYETNEQTNGSCQWQPLLRRHIVDLDSSTPHKFSRHWIVHLPMISTLPSSSYVEALFPDSSAVGYFVRQWVGRLAEQQATGQLQRRSPTLQQHLFFTPPISTTESHVVTNPLERVRCVVDTGVYTRNRLFRLLGSCKHGKPAVATLRIAETNLFPFAPSFGNHSFYPPAMMEENDSDPKLSLFDENNDVDLEVKNRIANTDWTVHAEALAQTFVVPLDNAKNINVILPSLSPPVDSVLGDPPCSKRMVSSSRSTLHVGLTPYPVVDDFVVSHLASKGGVQGIIRGWSVDCDPNTQQTRLIIYQIGRNRFCECIGRPHKSNHIAWNVDVQLGHCYQTCHDPECRGLNFRGRPIHLPPNVNSALQEILFEEELGRFEMPDCATAPLPTLSQPSDCNGSVATTNKAAESLPPPIISVSSLVNSPSAVANDDSFELALASLNLEEVIAKAKAAESLSNGCMSDHPSQYNALTDRSNRYVSDTNVPPSKAITDYDSCGSASHARIYQIPAVNERVTVPNEAESLRLDFPVASSIDHVSVCTSSSSDSDDLLTVAKQFESRDSCHAESDRRGGNAVIMNHPPSCPVDSISALQVDVDQDSVGSSDSEDLLLVAKRIEQCK